MFFSFFLSRFSITQKRKKLIFCKAIITGVLVFLKGVCV